jgi:CDP-6-deoxy-D-xylo-4-hexulose-3-dehydrase
MDKLKHKFDGRYGGSVCDKKEEQAITKTVHKCIKSGNWQAGLEAKKMEDEASKTLGLKYGILTTSGSCAGLLALSALELPNGSEVIISAVTFPTIFNIILQCNLVPVVVDAKIGSYTFDVKEVEKAITEKTRAIIAVHPVGNPCDMEALMKVVKNKGIWVLEDCCDTWGASINGKMLGTFGDIMFTSFHAAHIVSMGVGGGVFTNSKVLAGKVRQYRDWGRIADASKPHNCKSLPKDQNPRFVYDKIGYNFQILELQAAMGRVQLKKAKKIKKLRKKNFDYLYKNLAKYKELILPVSVKGADVCWFAFPLTVTGEREPLVSFLEKHGVETRSMFAGVITNHPAYEKSIYRIDGDLLEANYILEHSFWITVHPRLTKSDLDYIIGLFDKYYAKNS